jgi:hypothetical protein
MSQRKIKKDGNIYSHCSFGLLPRPLPVLKGWLKRGEVATYIQRLTKFYFVHFSNIAKE